MRRLVSLVFATIILVSIVGCTRNKNYDGDLDIYVISYPAYFFTQQLVGNEANVVLMNDTSSSTRNLVVTDEMKTAAKDGDLIIYQSSEKQVTLVEEILNQSMADSTEDSPSYLQIFDASVNINELPSTKSVMVSDDVTPLYQNHENNPYYWLDPIRMQVMVSNIKDFLVEQYPELEDQVEENYMAIEGKLFQIDAQMREIINEARVHSIVVDAPYFDHWTKYGIYEVSLRNYSSFEYKSDSELSSIKSFITDNTIKYIVSAEDSDLEKLQALAAELGVEIVSLHNIEKLSQEEIANGETYYTLMKKNMDVLVEIMK